MTKNNIQEKIKSIIKYDENLTNDYNIFERVLVEIYDHDTRSFTTKTFKLIDYIGDCEGRDSKVLEYYIYIVQKKKEQGGCDTREHFQCINSGEYFLNIKSLKSCGISIFTNSLKIKKFNQIH